jgi:hypothetical protein
MPRQSRTDQEIGYLRAAWEEVDYAEVDSHWKVSIKLVKDRPRGCWQIIMTAEHENLFNELMRPIACSYSWKFPNAREQTFAGALWEALHKFNVQMDETEDWWKRAH